MIFVFVFAFRFPALRFLRKIPPVFTDVKGGIEDLGFAAKSSLDRLFMRYLYLSGVERENERLRRELDVLKLSLRSSFFVAQENRRLLECFGLRSAWRDVLVTRATGSVVIDSGKRFFVDAGKKDGVREGFPVVSTRGLLGCLDRVGARYSEVETVFSQGFTAAVLIVPGGVMGLYRGGNPGSVDFVFKTEKVFPGDVVFTSGGDGRFPSGIPVGVVLSVRPRSQFKEIKVLPFAEVKLGMFAGVLRR